MINGSGTDELRKQSNHMETIRKEALAGMGEILEEGKSKISDLSSSVGEEVTATKVKAEKRIQAKPLQYVAGATLGGLVLGYLLGKKR